MTAPFAAGLAGWKASAKNKLGWALVPNFADVDSADAGPRSHNKSPYNALPDTLGGRFLFITRFLSNMDFSSSPFKGNFVHSQFH